jgi:SAM-dependent methyltransferase
MLSDTVRNVIGRFSHHTSAQALAALDFAEPDIEVSSEATVSKAEPAARLAWPSARLDLVHQLWGSGFVFPGGEIETLRLARPLGASAATSLLIVGVGSGGPASSVASNMGTWVTGMESDPSLLASACKLFSKNALGKKVSIKPWDPVNPDFVARSHHHCLALQALAGARPEPILDGLARVLRPGGQLVLTELTAAAPLDRLDPAVIRWSALEARDPADVPVDISITRMLGRVGLDVRVAEDISTRHMEQAMLGWRVMLRELRDRKPTRQEAIQMVSEAELWLLRRRLIGNGKLRMMRWHAMSRVPSRDQAGLPLVKGFSTA